MTMKTILRKENPTQLVKITDNTFTESEYEMMISAMNETVDGNIITFSTKDWPEDLVSGVDGHSDVYPIVQLDIMKLLADKCMSILGTTDKYENYSAMYYEGYGQCGLNWHTDMAYTASASIYLNDDWDDNYGGYFVFRMDGGNKLGTVVRPDLGVAVFQKGKIDHAVTSTRHDAPKRKSIQVFIK